MSSADAPARSPLAESAAAGVGRLQARPGGG